MYSWSPYVYSRNNPIVLLDPNGKNPGYGMTSPEQYLAETMETIYMEIYGSFATGAKETKNEAIKLANEIHNSTLAFDASWTMGLPFVNSTTLSFGLSYNFPMDLDTDKMGLYPHVGIGTGTSTSLNNGPEFSLGVVSGNYSNAGDYAGPFHNVNMAIFGIGGNYCWWPKGSNATSLSFNPADFATSRLTGIPTVSRPYRVDYYFILPFSTTADVPSISTQFTNMGKIFGE